MPPSSAHWQFASARVDLTAPTVGPDRIWKYWFPEARLVMCSGTLRRQIRFICNWLRLREVWLHLVASTSYQSDTVYPLRNQEWREYLYTSTMTQSTEDQATSNIAFKRNTSRQRKAAEKKRVVHDMFRAVFKQNVMDCGVPPTWFGRSLQPFVDVDTEKPTTEQVTTLNPIPDATDTSEHAIETMRTIQLIAWELEELGFRWELIQLDKHLVYIHPDDLVEQRRRQSLLDAIFPGKCTLHITRLPSSAQGVTANTQATRAPYIEALRLLLCRWPNVPTPLVTDVCFTSTANPQAFQEAEDALLLFYCQTFWISCGRAPVLPRQVPREPSD